MHASLSNAILKITLRQAAVSIFVKKSYVRATKFLVSHESFLLYHHLPLYLAPDSSAATQQARMVQSETENRRKRFCAVFFVR